MTSVRVVPAADAAAARADCEREYVRRYLIEFGVMPSEQHLRQWYGEPVDVPVEWNPRADDSYARIIELRRTTDER